MGIFNKKYILNPLLGKNKENRRNFMRKSAAALFGAVVLTKAEDLLSMTSKTGFIYIKQNGEIINNYKPSAGIDPYIGEIAIFAFNYAPQGYAFCNGQLLSTTSYNSLFTILGTTYGGNGTTNFAVPDFRGKAPVSFGTGTGLSTYNLGDMAGVESVALSLSELPAHNHSLNIYSGEGSTTTDSGNYVAQYGEGIKSFSNSSDTSMNSNAIGSAGGSQAHTNMQPYLALNYCIALQGIYPTP